MSFKKPEEYPFGRVHPFMFFPTKNEGMDTTGKVIVVIALMDFTPDDYAWADHPSIGKMPCVPSVDICLEEYAFDTPDAAQNQLDAQRFIAQWWVRELAKLGPAYDVLGTLKHAREELRLLREKDTGVVYDPTLRIRVADVIRQTESVPAPVVEEPPLPLDYDGKISKDPAVVAGVSQTTAIIGRMMSAYLLKADLLKAEQLDGDLSDDCCQACGNPECDDAGCAVKTAEQVAQEMRDEEEAEREPDIGEMIKDGQT